jgi:molecular chaperone HscB
MTTNTSTSLCLHCGKPAAAQLVCAGCGVVEPTIAQGSDYFAVFALPRRLSIDLADLEQRYYALSRRLHPDVFSDRSAAEQVASLRASALVNRAYKTLKDPVQRGLYWLELNGESLGRANERVPPALAARVFEVQEQLEELRAARQRDSADTLLPSVDGVRSELRDDLRACDRRLAANFARTDAGGGNGDAAAALAETKAILSELHYVRTLLRDVDKELGAEWNAS